MAEEQEQTATRRRTPIGARLPQVALNDAAIIAQALSDLAGPASAQIVAQHLHVSAASSGFNTRLAAAGYFGLVSRNGKKYELTGTGLGLTAGDANSKRASAQAALMATNFGRLIQVLSGRSVNEETIAARLQSDLEVPATSAQKLAGVLVASAEQAGILTEGRFNAMEIEAAMASLPAPPPEPVLSRPAARRPLGAANDSGKRQPSGEVKFKVKEAQTSPKPPLAQPLSSTSNLTLNLELNVSHLSVDEIVLLIEKLKAQPES